MNLISLFPTDFISDTQVRLKGRRRDHILAVHQAKVGEFLTVGKINGLIGKGQLSYIGSDALEMIVALDTPPPPPLPLTLILALPRPKMIKRIYRTIAEMGVKKLILLNSYRVEKSFWQSPTVSKELIHDNLILGLEQAKDTVLPDVIIHKRFKPFVEDELPEMIKHTRALVAHPGAGELCPQNLCEQVTLAVGPEGGFIPYEIDKFLECGFTPIHLGKRILRVETAIPVLLSKLF